MYFQFTQQVSHLELQGSYYQALHYTAVSTGILILFCPLNGNCQIKTFTGMLKFT